MLTRTFKALTPKVMEELTLDTVLHAHSTRYCYTWIILMELPRSEAGERSFIVRPYPQADPFNESLSRLLTSGNCDLFHLPTDTCKLFTFIGPIEMEGVDEDSVLIKSCSMLLKDISSHHALHITKRGETEEELQAYRELRVALYNVIQALYMAQSKFILLERLISKNNG